MDFLGVRSWVCRFFALIVLAAGTGLAIKRAANIFPLVVFSFSSDRTACHVLVTFATRGSPRPAASGISTAWSRQEVILATAD